MRTEDHIELSTELQQVFTTNQAWHYRAIPKILKDDSLTIWIDEANFDPKLANELEIIFDKKITLEKVSSTVISKTLGRYYRRNLGEGKMLSENSSDDFLIRLILEAKELKSSDIHIEIYDEKARVRMRIDGTLVERYQLKKDEYPSIVNKVKIKSNLDIAEKRLPQDGRIFFESNGKKLDIRVSVLPTLHGEKIVMRLLSNDATDIDIKLLGFKQEELDNYLEGIKKPHGIILISGPTGSGKTTTLYSTLKILNEEKRNIVTIEDPIEYTLEGINQVQLKESIGLTFPSALRTFLRQDPDIIMLGEIRDAETAQMAIRAALTGHLVLSTIHTNSAWGTVSRLIDMGVPPFLLSGTLNTSVAQRLVRKLCEHCKTEEIFDKSLYPKNFQPIAKVEKHQVATGCGECFYTGYKGRVALYEVLSIDKELSDQIKQQASTVTEILKEKKIKTLAENAFEAFRLGATSLDEVYPILLNQE